MKFETRWDETLDLTFTRTAYIENNGLAITVDCTDNEGFVEPYAVLTVNMSLDCLQPNQACIDPLCDDLLLHLCEAGYAAIVGTVQRTFDCVYIAEFGDEFLTNICTTR